MSTLVVLFLTSSIQFNLPPKLIDSLCYVESKHTIAAVHKDDGGSSSLGVCQIKLKTAAQLGYKGSENGLMDPKTNIHFAAKYLAYNINRYHGSIAKAVIAYNRGNAKNLTTSKYQSKVFNEWRNRYENAFVQKNK